MLPGIFILQTDSIKYVFNMFCFVFTYKANATTPTGTTPDPTTPTRQTTTTTAAKTSKSTNEAFTTLLNI
jgi:hypothetical protein